MESTKAAKPAKVHRRWGGVAIAIVATILVGAYIVEKRMGRIYSTMCWYTAIQHSLETDCTCLTFHDVLSHYNTYEGRRFDVYPDVEPDHEFISPRGLTDGEYLVFVEVHPGFVSDWTRYVIFASPDGSTMRMETVWNWNLDDVRARDAERRQESRTRE